MTINSEKKQYNRNNLNTISFGDVLSYKKKLVTLEIEKDTLEQISGLLK